jgi:hypothetical protein
MFQLFLRARAHQLFGARAQGSDFKARGAERDAESDRLRVESILNAIETAWAAAESEHAGLSARVEDVLARAAVTFGNDSDEYLSREPLNSHHQDLFTKELLNGQRRLKELADTISHFKFLKTVLLTRFPNLKPELRKTRE